MDNKPSIQPKSESQVVGNIGMYYACYRLSLFGLNVMPTSRNARGIDIIAYDSDGKSFSALQVKTLSKKNPVPLGNSLEKIMGDWWIIINNATDGNGGIKTYILHPDEVREKAHRGEKEGKISYWLQPKDYAIDEYLEKWNRIQIISESLNAK